MKQEQRKVIDLAQQKYKRLVLGAWDRLEREARRERVAQIQEVRQKAKDAI